MGLIVPSTIAAQREDQPLTYAWFVGIDWGSKQHQVYVLDRDRRRVGERVVDHDGSQSGSGWRTGCGRCRRANRSGWPWPSKCRGARLSKGCSNAASTSLRLIPNNSTGSGIVTVSPAPRMTGAMPLSWPIPCAPISPVFVGSNWKNRNSYGYESSVARKKRCSKTSVAVPIGCGTSCTGFIPRCSRCARGPMSPGCGT